MKHLALFAPLSALVLAVTTGVLPAQAGAQATPSYTTTDLGATAQGFGVFVNDHGMATGTNGARRSIWVDTSGSRQSVTGTPARSTEVAAFGNSNRGQILVRAAFHRGRNHRLYVVSGAASPHPLWRELPLPRDFHSSLPGGIASSGSWAAGTLFGAGTATRPALWRLGAGQKTEPTLLPLSRTATAGSLAAVAAHNGTVYAAGSMSQANNWRATLWIPGASRISRVVLRSPAKYRRSSAVAVAVAANGTVYVAGNLIESSESAPAAALWTVSCQSTCTQMSFRLLAPFGGVEAVNAAGSVVGWTRPGGDPGPAMQWNPGGSSWPVPGTPYSINRQGTLGIEGPVHETKWHAFLARPNYNRDVSL